MAKAGLDEEGRRSLAWGLSHGAIFDHAKAQFMVFTRGRLSGGGSFNFGTQSLEAAHEVKWLGVWLDPKLNFNRYFKALEEKTARTLTQLSIFGNSRRGVTESNRTVLMKMVLFPRITYGAAVWATQENQGKITRLANKVNQLAGIYVLGVFKSTSNIFISNRSPVPQFEDAVVKSCFSFFYRKLIFLKTNNIVRDLVLASRCVSSGRL